GSRALSLPPRGWTPQPRVAQRTLGPCLARPAHGTGTGEKAMKRWGDCVVVLVGAAGAAGEEPPGAGGDASSAPAGCDGAETGFADAAIYRLEKDDMTRLRTTGELDLTFRRHNALVRVRMEHGTEETPEGKVLGVFMRQFHAGGRQLHLAGEVEGERLHTR